MLRETCLSCVLKHLSQSYVLLSEYFDDPIEFEEHFFYAIGHLAEACDESKKDYPLLGAVLRATRRKLQEEDEYWPDFKPLFRWVRRLGLLVNNEEVDQEELESYISQSIAPILDYLPEEEEEEEKKIKKVLKNKK